MSNELFWQKNEIFLVLYYYTFSEVHSLPVSLRKYTHFDVDADKKKHGDSGHGRMNDGGKETRRRNPAPVIGQKISSES